MRAVVKKWGNSASVRIPAAIMQAARLELDDAVEVREEAGRIVIEPIRKPARGSSLRRSNWQRSMVAAKSYVPHTGDIVWLELDPHLGHEQAGHRPALVLSPAAYNEKTSLMVAAR